MLKKPYATRGEWEKHINAHPLVVHDIWPRIKNYLTIDPSHIVGLPAGVIPYGTGVDTGLAGNVNNIYYDATNNLLGVREAAPTCRVHINSVGANIPALNLESGAEGELVTPDTQQLRIGHWNAGTTTFTERMKIDDDGKVFVSYLSVGSVLVSGAGGELVQDNARFFYNVGLHRLAIGHMGPTNSLHIDDVGTTSGWGGAYGGIIARFTCTQVPSKHTTVVIDSVAGYDAVLGFCEGGGVRWALRHNEDDHAFQLRYHFGVNRVDLAIDTAGNVTMPTGTLGCGTITVRDGESINLQEDITFTGATTVNQIKFPDNLPDALSFKQAGNAYQTFVTTNGSEAIWLHKNVGIGIALPLAKLDVVGTVRLGDSADNYAAFAADGELTLLGTARVKNHVRVGAASWKVGGTAPIPGFVGICPVLKFDSATDDEAHYSLLIPYRLLAGSTIDVIVDWCYTGGQDDGTVCWKLDYANVAPGEAVDAGVTTITVTTGGTHPTGDLIRSTLLVGIEGTVAHDDLELHLWRDVSEDTLGTSADLVQVHFEYVRDKLGLATV